MGPHPSPAAKSLKSNTALQLPQNQFVVTFERSNLHCFNQWARKILEIKHIA
jgi:hypothetical protein